MLTVDLVRARKRGKELKLIALDGPSRVRAIAMAEGILAIVAAHVGQTRGELETALEAIDAGPREYKLRDALAKLGVDRCEFEAEEAIDAEGLRSALFSHATAARRALGAGEVFDRAGIVGAVAERLGISAEALDRRMFADLRDAHVLNSFAPIRAQTLVELYERAQAQAVLLRAVQVTVDVRCASAAGARALFRRLKFLQLLYTITKTATGHRVVIDGPFSLFESVTKYGLKLAMIIPALDGCDAWEMVADLRWGKAREPLTFALSGGSVGRAGDAPELSDEVLALVRAFEKLGTPWSVTPARDILEMPGVGLSVPDLVFEKDGVKVYFEVMGYWSRAAVWKRVELVEAGLSQPVIFAVSARLRVSEEVLPDDAPGALYVYKTALSARAVAERLERIARCAQSARSAR